MDNWNSLFTYDPIDALVSSGNKAVSFFAAKFLLDNENDNPQSLWLLPEARHIISRQQKEGSWKYPGGNTKIRTQENYDQIETYRNLGYLVESFGFDNRHPVISKAANFLFHFQKEEGDIRGILGNQYTPYYTAAIIELLIKSGYMKDERVENAFKWLNSIRQNDGGWAIPFRTLKKNLNAIAAETKTLQPNKTQPFSHLVTGVVLRAYAAHDEYRNAIEAKIAGKLLLSNFFKKDNYPDRASPDFWLKFTFPFWFTDLISALDSLSMMGFKKNEPQIETAIQWLLSQQQENGIWKLKTLKNKHDYQTDLWLSLAICRIIKRLYT